MFSIVKYVQYQAEKQLLDYTCSGIINIELNKACQDS